MHLKQFKDAVETFQNSLHESKSDQVKDMLIDAMEKLKK